MSDVELRAEAEIARLTEAYLKRRYERMSIRPEAFAEDEIDKTLLDWQIARQRTVIAEARLPQQQGSL